MNAQFKKSTNDNVRNFENQFHDKSQSHSRASGQFLVSFLVLQRDPATSTDEAFNF